MNKKIMEFGELMEKLIDENQRMKINIEEHEKKEIYFKKQMIEFSRVKDETWPTDRLGEERLARQEVYGA